MGTIVRDKSNTHAYLEASVPSGHRFGRHHGLTTQGESVTVQKHIRWSFSKTCRAWSFCLRSSVSPNPHRRAYRRASWAKSSTPPFLLPQPWLSPETTRMWLRIVLMH